MKLCSVCGKRIEKEDPAVLVMTAFAHPKHICEECEAEFDRATLSHSPEEINGAIEAIGKKMIDANTDDKLILETVNGILEEASERCALIESGDYDFSNDECDAEEENDVPEELLETEEDRAQDEADEKTRKKIDKILNWVCGAIIAAAVGFVIYRLIDTFFL